MLNLYFYTGLTILLSYRQDALVKYIRTIFYNCRIHRYIFNSVVLFALLCFSNTLYVYDIAWYSELPSATLLILDIMGCDRTRMWVIEAWSSLCGEIKKNYWPTDQCISFLDILVYFYESFNGRVERRDVNFVLDNERWSSLHLTIFNEIFLLSLLYYLLNYWVNATKNSGQNWINLH